MKRQAPWIAIIAFSAFSATAVAAEGDSMRHDMYRDDPQSVNSPAPAEEAALPNSNEYETRGETQATGAETRGSAAGSEASEDRVYRNRWGDSSEYETREVPGPSESDRSSSSGASSSGTSPSGASSSSDASSLDRSAAVATSFEEADRDGNGALDGAEASAAGIDFFAAQLDEESAITIGEYHYALELMDRLPER